jgi:surfeit locus 1 family protein
MIGLSVWQVDRLQWKTAMIEERQARLAGEPIALPPVGADVASLEFRRVMIAGTFLHEREMLLGARSLNGNVGYQVVTPMTLATGGTVLVNRGWIPARAKAPSARAAGQVSGDVGIEGVIRLPKTRAWMQPENEPRSGQWFYVDVAAMARAAGIDARQDLYVEAGSAENPGGLPIGGQTRINLPNDHLQYAITWALLAIILMVIYVAYHLKLEREKTGAP